MTIARLYPASLDALYSGKINYLTADVVCALFDNTYTPNETTDAYLDDLSGELTDASYDRVTLSGKTQAYNPVARSLVLDADDVVFPSLTETNVRYAVFFVDTGVAGTSPLLGYWDFEANYNPSANNFKLTLSSAGLLTATLPT